jgi:hypothetical protein
VVLHQHRSLEACSFSINSGPGIGALFAVWVAGSGILTDKAKALNQELIKQKMVVYNEVAPCVNGIYCYLMFVGAWKNSTPDDVVALKRSADKEMHIYRALLGEDLFAAYRAFIQCSFRESSETGMEATIRLDPSIARQLRMDDWKESWDAKLAASQAPPRKSDSTYVTLMMRFAKELGADGEPWRVIPPSPTRVPDPFTGGHPLLLGLRGAPSDSNQEVLYQKTLGR